jgi:acyl-CoA synthetase (AMP-forming)/AMP-acid ligase II
MIFTSAFPELTIPTTLSLSDFVFQGARKHSKKIFFKNPTDGFTLSFGQTELMSITLTKNIISKLNIAKGTVFAMILPNVPLYPVIFHGIIMAGGVVTTINPNYTDQEINGQLIDSQSRFVISQEQTTSRTAIFSGSNVLKSFVVGEVENITSNVSSLSSMMEEDLDISISVTIDPINDVVCIPYSSGTTGRSKGVMLTHYNIISNIMQIEYMEAFQSDEVRHIFSHNITLLDYCEFCSVFPHLRTK